ncbi:ATP phosphoribosyltransferase, partial [Smithella sp. F21]
DVVEVADLPYSKQTNQSIRLVLAVAKDSTYKEVSDLQNKRIATELVRVTKKYLAARGVQAEVEYSYGATEVKVPHLVDAIAELTETGASLQANGLRIIATILESTPRFIAHKQSWNDINKRIKIQNIALLLQGALRAEAKVGLKMNVAQENINQVLDLLSAMKRPTVSSLVGGEGVAIEVIMDEKKVRDLIPALKRAGAEDIIEYPLNKVIP